MLNIESADSASTSTNGDVHGNGLVNGDITVNGIVPGALPALTINGNLSAQDTQPHDRDFVNLAT